MDSSYPITQKLPKLPWISKKLFYGWTIVFVGAVTQFFQGLVAQGFSTYLTPLQDEFGWSKAALAGPRSATSLENSIFGPLTGFLVDRFGPRALVASGVVILGAGAILFGLTHSMLMYYVSNIIMAIGSSIEGLVVMSVAVNNWFRRKRSMGQAVMLLGYSMAGVIGIPAMVFIQTYMGWRTSAIVTGVVIIVVGIPCSMLLRSRPEPYGLKPDGETRSLETPAKPRDIRVDEEFSFTLREALRTRSFWFIALAWGIANLGTGAMQVHLFLHLEEGIGLPRATAAFVWTVASLTNMPARVAGGYLGDRWPKNIVVGATMIILAASLFILGIANSLNLAMMYAVTYGIAWGMRTPAMNAMQAEYFGTKSQGTIRGWIQTISLPFSVVAPVAAGFMADAQGNYRMTFIISAATALVGSLLFFLAVPPGQPHRKASPYSK